MLFEGELHGLVKNFFDQYPLNLSCEVEGSVKIRSLPDPSVLAMACLVVILKLLFVLDDKVEK